MREFYAGLGVTALTIIVFFCIMEQRREEARQRQLMATSPAGGSRLN